MSALCHTLAGWPLLCWGGTCGGMGVGTYARIGPVGGHGADIATTLRASLPSTSYLAALRLRGKPTIV